jgi:hypothetical protein
MSLSKNLNNLLIASRHLPFQAYSAIMAIIAIPFLGYKVVENVVTDWTEMEATYLEVTKIQERTKKGNPNYFFTLIYQVNHSDTILKVGHELDYESMAEANYYSEFYMEKDTTVYLNQNNFQVYQFDQVNTYWIPYLIVLIVVALILYYDTWLIMKFIELELRE